MFTVGCVPYLNAKPLVAGLERFRKDLRLVFQPPSALARGLRAGKFDVALVPVMELFEGRPYTVMANLGIASAGNTDSVRLYHKVPVSRIRSVALDRNSKTSNALTRVTLENKYGRHPRYSTYNPRRRDLSDLAADAAVVIGDLSFRRPPACFNGMRAGAPLPFLDLGTEWVEWTKLPFVYALWVARPGVPHVERIAAILSEAKERGKRRLHAIAAREAKRLNLSRQFCLHYLTRCIYYDCGPREIEGLLAFGRAAAGLGLCSGEVHLDFR